MGTDVAVGVTGEYEAAGGAQGGGAHVDALLMHPAELTGFDVDGEQVADLVGTGGEFGRAEGHGADCFTRDELLDARGRRGAGLLDRDVEAVRVGAVGTRLPQLSDGESGAEEDFLVERGEDQLFVGDDAAVVRVTGDDVLINRVAGPERL